MKKRISVFLGLTAVTTLLWFASAEYAVSYASRLFRTFFVLTVLYFVFKVAFESIINRRIEGAKTRYSFRKTVSVLYLVIATVALTNIWVQNPQSLLVAYGLLGAGVAVSLQDVFKNFAGGVVVFLGGLYSVGDRVEIGSRAGDVIDVGIMYTTLMEMQGWVDGDQATGRIATVPNGVVLSQAIHNFTKDYDFIWDEITIPLTYDSDWREARETMLGIVEEETADTQESAVGQIEATAGKYYMSTRAVDPSVYVTITDNWINLRVRYVTDARERRDVHNRLQNTIWDALEGAENVEIASENIEISRVPEFKVS